MIPLFINCSLSNEDISLDWRCIHGAARHSLLSSGLSRYRTWQIDWNICSWSGCVQNLLPDFYHSWASLLYSKSRFFGTKSITSARICGHVKLQQPKDAVFLNDTIAPETKNGGSAHRTNAGTGTARSIPTGLCIISAISTCYKLTYFTVHENCLQFQSSLHLISPHIISHDINPLPEITVHAQSTGWLICIGFYRFNCEKMHTMFCSK